jgi:hypothetical protein
MRQLFLAEVTLHGFGVTWDHLFTDPPSVADIRDALRRSPEPKRSRPDVYGAIVQELDKRRYQVTPIDVTNNAPAGAERKVNAPLGLDDNGVSQSGVDASQDANPGASVRANP